MVFALKWVLNRSCTPLKRDIDLVTAIFGLRQSDSWWRARDVGKVSDCKDGERIGQRWMRQAREMCISICLRFMCPSGSISLCLSSWTHTVLLHSLILMEFREGVKERGEKIKTARLYSRDPLFLWDVLCQHHLPVCLCKTTHTNTT